VNPLPVLRDVMSSAAIKGLAQDVIQRLSAQHAGEWNAPKDEISLLCQALGAPYPYAAQKFIAQLVEAGVPLERIYRNYMTEAARELGRRWEQDRISFEEVGIATARLYLILDDLRRKIPPSRQPDKPRIAFAAVPGEMHTLGVEMAVDLFRREGWNVEHLLDMTHDELLDAVADTDIVMIGLSASGKRRRAALLKLVVSLRVARPDLKIILSGAITQTEPDMIAQIGIDAIVRDVPSALRIVEELVGPKT
jgi:methanogenic corrinoid protein MtbC1